jgi:hypothetical protein
VKILKIITKDINDVMPFLNGHTDYVSEDEGIIELVVGYGLAKEMGASILNHQLDKNKYWTFLPREKRTIFKEHIENLIKEGYNNLVGDVRLKNLDPIKYETPEIFLKSIEKAIRGGKGYLYSDRLYIYNGLLYHIDMGLLEFMSWDIKEDIVRMIDNTDVNIEDYKDDLKYIDKKYIPYLIYAKENTISSNLRQ